MAAKAGNSLLTKAKQFQESGKITENQQARMVYFLSRLLKKNNSVAKAITSE